MKILTFGTSLTARGGWQAPLKAALERCGHVPVTIDIVAKSGVTSDWGLAHLDDVVAQHPDLVLVEFYANDAAVNRLTTVSRSRATIEALLDGLKTRLPGTRVISMVMNPMSGLRGFWARPFLESYVEAHQAAAVARGFETIDFRPAWQRLFADRLDTVIPDGVHPAPDAAAEVMVPPLVAAIDRLVTRGDRVNLKPA